VSSWGFLKLYGNGGGFISISGSLIYTATIQQPNLISTDTNGSSGLSSDINNPQVSNGKQFKLSGKAYANGPVKVEIHSDPIICNTVADANGDWTCTFASAIPDGSHLVTVYLTDPANGQVRTVGPYYMDVLASTVSAPNTGLRGAISPMIYIILGLSSVIAIAILAKRRPVSSI